MSQIYDNNKPASGVTHFSELYQIIRDNFEAIRSSFSGTSFPTTPTPIEGQPFFNKTTKVYYVYSDGDWEQVAKEGTGLGLEVVNARGSKTTLDSRLDVALNDDGTLRASTTLNPSQWLDPSFTVAYVSSSSFMVLTNQIDIYVKDRRLKFTLITGHYFSEVVSSSYNSGTGLTTIIIRDGILNATLSKVEHSIVSPRYSGDGAINYKTTGAHKIITEVKTENYNVTTDDFGKTLVMNTDMYYKNFYLPSVAFGEIGGWIEFVKIPSGGLIISPADNDVIEDGGAGDFIYCSEGESGPSSLKLKLITETLWKIESGIGTWVTTD